MSSLAGPWLLVPLVLALLCLGCGTLVLRVAGRSRSWALALPAGYAFVVVATSTLVWIPGAAPLAVPVTAGLAAAGLVTLVRDSLARPGRGDLLAGAAGLAAFLAYGAPALLVGEPTFAGYVTLDDAATWFALTDWTLVHGRSTEGLAPSTFEATLDSYLGSGYPLGALLPLGVAARLARQDVAWAFQPYLAFLGALLALALATLARRLPVAPWAQALVAVVAAQPALLYAYAQWTGVKEVAAAALVAAACGLAAAAGASLRGALPAAVAAAALACVLSPGGLVWLAAGAALALVVARRGRRPLLAAGALTAVLSLPALATAATFVRRGGDVLTGAGELGNLLGPLSAVQAAGIWPSSDFRLRPDAYGPTLVLVALVTVLAAAGVAAAARDRAWERVAYVLTSVSGAAAIVAFGSPWVDAKALATAAPALVFAALSGCAWLAAAGRRAPAALAAAAVCGGVAWSNAATLGGASLAPHDQLAELQAIGERYAGAGPALMTEYQPYGVRHFLRSLDAEGVSELRRRAIPRRDGTLVPKGATADLDELELGAVLAYRTVVLRRSPVTSRPPYPYELRWRGRWYEVWQRVRSPAPTSHLPLGNGAAPAAVPPCPAVRDLAAGAAALVAARRDPRVVAGTATAGGAATLAAPVAGRYGVWVEPAAPVAATVLVDGRRVGSVARRRDTTGQYLPAGTVRLTAGPHTVELRPRGRPLVDAAAPSVRFVVARLAPARLVSRPSSAAPSLCGRAYDWLETVGRGTVG